MKVNNDKAAEAALERAYELIDAAETHYANAGVEQYTRRQFQRVLDDLGEVMDEVGVTK